MLACQERWTASISGAGGFWLYIASQSTLMVGTVQQRWPWKWNRVTPGNREAKQRARYKVESGMLFRQ